MFFLKKIFSSCLYVVGVLLTFLSALFPLIFKIQLIKSMYVTVVNSTCCYNYMKTAQEFTLDKVNQGLHLPQYRPTGLITQLLRLVYLSFN